MRGVLKVTIFLYKFDLLCAVNLAFSGQFGGRYYKNWLLVGVRLIVSVTMPARSSDLQVIAVIFK